MITDRTAFGLSQPNGFVIVCLVQLVACVQRSLPSVQRTAITPGHQPEVGLPDIKSVFMAASLNKKGLVVVWENLDLAWLKGCVTPQGTGKNQTSVTAKRVSPLAIN